MIAQAEIRKLPLQEKLALLETVWSELSSEPENVDIPQWHKDLLDERDAALRDGSVVALDWEEAKRQIRSATQ